MVQRASGIPCALSFSRANVLQTSGDQRREIAKLYLPSLRGAKRRSNPSCHAKKEWIASLRSQ
jgi:hypothetical protein